MTNCLAARKLANHSTTYSDETLQVDIHSDGVVFYAMFAADVYLDLVHDWLSSRSLEGRIVEHARSDDGYCGAVILNGPPELLLERLRRRFQTKQLIVRVPSADERIELKDLLRSNRKCAA